MVPVGGLTLFFGEISGGSSDASQTNSARGPRIPQYRFYTSLALSAEASIQNELLRVEELFE